ncbi:MAG: ethanolamine ammonia-lyase subunit EutC [Pseudomonadota bacterium]|nr:ethanolamine ammonia-lyase [Pseudomonadales bacterium]MDY6920974.1 ethanolamine ammonia-lyase subunit EutC [Pseudomonadota bacterium]
MNDNSPVIENPWQRLRRHTSARIGLGRAGISLPTSRLLEFQLAHARARDAVHLPLDVPALLAALPPWGGDALRLQSRAGDRTTYLQRPDWGRQLADPSRQRLQQWAEDNRHSQPDLAVVVVDGLSSRAVQNHTANLLRALQGVLSRARESWCLAPLCVVEQGRVALGDEIGALLRANAVLICIGERPGLSSPDSLGLYLTWQPRRGRTDAERNCISNVRPEGLSCRDAVTRLLYLLQESRRQRLTGVGLKDRTDDGGKTLTAAGTAETGSNFLLGRE